MAPIYIVLYGVIVLIVELVRRKKNLLAKQTH